MSTFSLAPWSFEDALKVLVATPPMVVNAVIANQGLRSAHRGRCCGR
jgi:hypothetical protein